MLVSLTVGWKAWRTSMDFGLTSLVWARESLENEGPSTVDGNQIAETLRRDRGIDCRAKYRRQWTLPPSSAAEVAADVMAALRVVDDRPSETVALFDPA